MMRVSVNVTGAKAGLDRIIRQLPYAQSLALNTLANQFQRVQQESVQRNFTLRQTRFILNTIKRLPGRDFATKSNLVATVRIDPNRQQLAKFEQGGEKQSIQGKQYVAVPARDIRRTKRGLVPRSLYPSAFRPWKDQANGVTLGANRTFIVPTKGGNRLMLQRTGKGKGNVRALYLFTPSVRIDPRLHFRDNAMAVARSAWPSAFASAWVQALRTAR